MQIKESRVMASQILIRQNNNQPPPRNIMDKIIQI